MDARVTPAIFDEIKRYVRFGPDDEAALRALYPHARPLFGAIADAFHARLSEFEGARAVFGGPEQAERHKLTLRDWLNRLLAGPWDDDYFEKRARIGRAHVRIDLPQRYMFGAMNLVRVQLQSIVKEAFADDRALRMKVVPAVAKILDLELMIMLETYREAFVERVQLAERVEKAGLERRLALSEARYAEIMEMAWTLVVTCDGDGFIELFNRRAEEVTGLGRVQATGKRWQDVFVPEERRAEADAICAQLRDDRKHEAAFEASFVGSGGHERRVRWHLTRLPSGGPPVLCAVGTDVTGEHELALRTQRAERLAALGIMAAGLAHEVRNPLNAAHLQLSVAQRRLARDPPDVEGARAATQLVSDEMTRLAGLVEEFLQFSRPQALQLRRGELRATVEQVLAVLWPRAEQAQITLTLEPGPGVVTYYDEERLKQVLHNLVSNALEATGGGGRVTVRVVAGAGGARVEVEDDGPGVPEGAPIFEPFFTTKASGTGLGLAIVHRIAADHGGRVDVDSRPGRTVFSLVLPGR